MRILVFQSDNRLLTRNQNDYHSLSAVINYQYCQKHGYDYIYYRPYLDDPTSSSIYTCLDSNHELRHSTWAKLFSTDLALDQEYDYVVYMDTDCIFKDFDQKIETFVLAYPEKDILFLNDKPWRRDRPNGGFYVLKVNSYTKRFAKDWYLYSIPERNRVHPFDQAALWMIYMKYNLKFVDQWFMREEPGQWLRHVTGSEAIRKTRTAYFQKFIQEKGIDFINTLVQIKTIDFNTRGFTFTV
jgi:hypothetical protein